MPFITEEIWQRLRERSPEGKADSIMIASYPAPDAGLFDADAEREMESVIEIVRSIRNARAESKVDPSRFIEAIISAGDACTALEAHAAIITNLARVQPLSMLGSGQKAETGRDEAKILVLKDVEVVLPLKGMVDSAAERERLVKEIEAVQGEIARVERLLGDGAFTGKAPAAVVEKERLKLSERRDRLGRLQERLDQLSG